MKERLAILWHRLKAGYHWNRMIAKIDGTERSHSYLVQYDPSYRRSSDIYNHSINCLVEAGEYIAARSLISSKRKSPSYAGSIKCQESN